MGDTTYDELLGIIDEFAGRLDPRERLARLYGLMAPLLDRVEREDEELSDDPMAWVVRSRHRMPSLNCRRVAVRQIATPHAAMIIHGGDPLSQQTLDSSSSK